MPKYKVSKKNGLRKALLGVVNLCIKWAVPSPSHLVFTSKISHQPWKDKDSPLRQRTSSYLCNMYAKISESEDLSTGKCLEENAAYLDKSSQQTFKVIKDCDVFEHPYSWAVTHSLAAGSVVTSQGQPVLVQLGNLFKDP